MTRIAVQHPLVDTSHDGVVVSSTVGRRVILTAGRADLLLRAEREGRRPVLVTAADAALSEPLVALLRGSGGAWGVTDGAGRSWNGFSGRRLDRADLADPSPVTEPGDLDSEWIRPGGGTSLRVRVIVTRRHRNTRDVVLGGDIAQLAEMLAGAPPAAWGPHEPCEWPWDRPALTAFARTYAEPLRLVVSGGRAGRALLATLFVHRTRFGVEEVTELLVDAGPAGADATDLRVLGIADVLAALAAGTPLLAVAFADPGRADLYREPRVPRPPWPLAMLLGAPGVRSMRVDATNLASRHGGRVLGARRTPSVLVDIGDPRPARSWQRLRAVLDDLGADRVEAAAPQLAALLRGGAR